MSPAACATPSARRSCRRSSLRGDDAWLRHLRATARFQRFAGTDDERLAAIARIAAHHDVDVALAVRGGYGWTRLLPRIDFGALAARGQRWLGHSDFTAFQLAAL